MYYLHSRYYDPETCRFINADSYASTGQGIIGYNMFAYCNNNPVNGVDLAGKDVIWIQEGDSAGYCGHSGLMIQNEDGDWFYFYWGPAEPKLNIFTKAYMILGGDVQHGSYIIPVDISDFDNNNTFADNVDSLQKSVKTALENEKITDNNRYLNLSSYYYISGDFTKSLVAAKKVVSIKEPYNLFSNNCLQVVLSVLKESYPIFGQLLRSPVSSLIPNVGYVCMKDLMKN